MCLKSFTIEIVWKKEEINFLLILWATKEVLHETGLPLGEKKRENTIIFYSDVQKYNFHWRISAVDEIAYVSLCFNK